jgi:hypothetical protein
MMTRKTDKDIHQALAHSTHIVIALTVWTGQID